MREIDSQSEARLSQALRRLAAASRRAAPEELGAALLGKFRRHHSRRRWIRRGGVLVLAAGIGLAVVSSLRTAPQHGSNQEIAQTVKNPEKPSAPVASSAMMPAQKVPVRQRSTKASVKAANRAFLALPAYDPSVPLDDMQVVRVQLPASALWTIGAPVPADAGEKRMLADFVVGQDGTAYAVRLVQ